MGLALVTRMGPLDSRPAPGDQIIPLAPLPASVLASCLEYRQRTWPTTINAHLFVDTQRLSRTFNETVDTSGIGDLT